MLLSTGIIAGLITMLCWGFADFMLAVVIKKIGNLKTLFASQLLALLPLGVLTIFWYGSLHISLFNLFLELIAGIMMSLAMVFFFRSLEIGQLCVVSPISASYPIVTVILAIIFLDESLSSHQMFAISAIIAGIVLVSTDIKK